MADRTVRVVIVGEDKLSPVAKSASKNLGALGMAASVAGGLITVVLAKKAAQAAGDLVRLGANSLMARDRLNAFAGGSANASAMLEALIKSSDGTIDRLTATQHAARLLQMGIVDTADDMGKLGAIVGKLGDQTLSLETRMQTFTMMMANQSKLRLDTFGLSVERVTARQKELEAQGYSTQEAFKIAVFEEADVALATLGDTSDTVATKIGRLARTFGELKTSVAEMVVESKIFDSVLTGLDISGQYITLTQQLSKYQKEMLALNLMTEEQIKLEDKAILGMVTRYSSREEQIAQLETLKDKIESHTAAIERQTRAVEMGGAAARSIAAHWEKRREAVERMTAAEARAALSAEIASRRRSEQLADFARRAEDLERTHQETLQSIIASGQQSASEIARDAYSTRLTALNAALQAEQAALRAAQQARMAALRAAQQAEMDALREAQQARMDAVREAMQAELAALAAGIAQRNFLKRLEDMARQHQERLKDIRTSGLETETEAENRRFQGVMDNLNKEQKARLDALKARYGKGDDAGTKREDLEEEHRRRMLGLYTDSAREQERKRYEAALKELEYQEEEAGLLEDFQEEKAAAEKAHRDELEAIRQRDLQRQIDEENKRYAEAVAAAHRQEELRKQDVAARNAIEERFAAILAAMEAQNRAEREAQEAAHNAARAAETGRSDAERAAMEQSHNAQRVALANQLKAQLDTIRQAEIAQRIAEENAAYARQQQDLQRARDRADNTWRDSLRRQRLAATEHMLETDKLTEEWAERQYLHVVYWRSQRLGGEIEGYAAGTDFHPGGLAIVGEKGPELLDLPRGSRVTPMTGAAGAGIIIHNYFGRDSIRSDRDVVKVVEQQEKAFRLRGVRTL